MAELPVTGYLDRLSCRPGGSLAAKISVRDGGPCRVTLERLICADPNPDGPGQRLEDLAALYSHDFIGRHQPIKLGSYADIPVGPQRDVRATCTWSALIEPGRVNHAQAVLWESGQDCSVILGHGPAGVFAELVWPGGSAQVETGVALVAKRWWRVWLSVDPATGQFTVGQQHLDDPLR